MSRTPGEVLAAALDDVQELPAGAEITDVIVVMAVDHGDETNEVFWHAQHGATYRLIGLLDLAAREMARGES